MISILDLFITYNPFFYSFSLPVSMIGCLYYTPLLWLRNFHGGFSPQKIIESFTRWLHLPSAANSAYLLMGHLGDL